MSGPVTVSVDGAVATVTVDNPPVNAMSREVMAALGQVAERLADDEGIRAIVATGAGSKAFMAGADIVEFQDILNTTGMAAHSAFANRSMAAWAALPQPVIAWLQASAVGGGLEFALTADVIVAARRARVGLPEVKLGLIPGGGGTQRLAQRVGASTARRLMMTATVLRAEEAQRLGVVDYVVDDGDGAAFAGELAARLAQLPRRAVQAVKALTTPELGAGFEREREEFLALTETADFTEGFTAFLAGRQPAFVHR
jgi:enoyl-CoA hydratase/carnithine racemase